jgi:hypothetical protein
VPLSRPLPSRLSATSQQPRPAAPRGPSPAFRWVSRRSGYSISRLARESAGTPLRPSQPLKLCSDNSRENNRQASLGVPQPCADSGFELGLVREARFLAILASNRPRCRRPVHLMFGLFAAVAFCAPRWRLPCQFLAPNSHFFLGNCQKSPPPEIAPFVFDSFCESAPLAATLARAGVFALISCSLLTYRKQHFPLRLASTCNAIQKFPVTIWRVGSRALKILVTGSSRRTALI